MADDTGPPHDIPFLEAPDPPSIHGITEAIATQVAARLSALVPPGSLIATARATPPSEFLLCDGAAVSRTTYADLFAAIGETYGAGNGTTTFNVPDLRGRVPVGEDGAAARLTANDALGNSGGEEKHQLTVAELAAHDHVIKSSNDNTTSGINWSAMSNGPNNVNYPTDTKGSDIPHNNMQPFQVVNWLIKI